MDTSDFITWISVLIAIWAFANPYHKLKIRFLSFWYKLLFIGLAFTIVFFSIIYPNNLFEIANYLNQFNLVLTVNKILNSVNIDSFLLSLFFASIFSWLFISKVFFNKKLNLKTDSGIQNSITLIDEIYNEGEKMYPELAQILYKNINDVIQIIKTSKEYEKLETPKIEINFEDCSQEEKNQDYSDTLIIEGQKLSLYNKIKNKTLVPFVNWKNKSILKHKEKLNAILMAILTDETFLNYIITREIGTELFLQCYRLSFERVNNTDFDKEPSTYQLVRLFIKHSLQNPKSKFYTYFDKDIETELIKEIFKKVSRIKNYGLFYVFTDWLVEDFDKEKGVPKINTRDFIQKLEVKIDLIFKFIEKLGSVIQKEKAQTDIWWLRDDLSDKLFKFLIDNKGDDLIFKILNNLEYLVDKDILRNDGDGSKTHGLVATYIEILIRLSNIQDSEKFIASFLHHYSKAYEYKGDMHENWGLIKNAFFDYDYGINRDSTIRNIFAEQIKRLLENKGFSEYDLHRLSPNRINEINDFIETLKNS